MNTYVNKKVSILAIEHPYEAYAMRVFSFMLIGLVCAYLYLVAASILNIVAQKDAMAQTSQLQMALGTLEQRYFALNENVTQQEGVALGLQSMTPDYIYRSGNVGLVTVNGPSTI